MAQLKYPYHEFSGALQQKTTTHIKKPNEVVAVKNVDFSYILGAMVRRKGAQGSEYNLPKLPHNSPPLGAFIARFSDAVEIWAVQNDLEESPPHPATLYRWTGPSPTDWTSIIGGIAQTAEVNMIDDLDEILVSIYDPFFDQVHTPFTVNSSHNVSQTRQLDFAPKGRFFIEFNGSMWAANVEIDAVRYPDRLYKSSGPMGVFAFVRAETTLNQVDGLQTEYENPLEVDSVRYVKPGQIIDVYQAGTDTLLYTLEVETVDKALDTVRFTSPDTTTFANTAIDTSGDSITVTDLDWLTTGTPVTFWQGTGTPTGLADGTVYYVIRVDSTHIQLATTRENALAGTEINIGSQGTGTHRITFTPVFGNKDEFWRTGRKGKLSRFWNTDYRNPETSDYLKIPSTLDAKNDITAVGKISNRLFIFTENATLKYDGQNLVPLRNDVGCIAHKTIDYYDSFMIWLDAKGKVWIRNDESGEQDIISEAIQETMALVPKDQLPDASSVCVDDKYKLFLGEVNGKSLRVIYNFRTNQWSEEWWTPQMPIQLEYTYQGNIHPHFFDEKGQFWVDEEGDTDNGEVIPLEIELGDDGFGVDEIKKYIGVKIYSKNSSGTKIYVSIDKGEFKPVGQITKNVEAISLEPMPRGTLINFKFTNSTSVDPPHIEKVVVWHNPEEDTFRATPR